MDTLPTAELDWNHFKKMSSGKAPGQDAIPAEVYKTGGPTLLNQPTSSYQFMWEKQQIPQKFRDTNVNPIIIQT